ncbi:hypothetical protein [Amycolatopsis magusensis]|uniref:hypothetical protein n=1 Tax=Amycolatopsis magusensis TaxID=882444 RepID=UPI0037AEFF1C
MTKRIVAAVAGLTMSAAVAACSAADPQPTPAPDAVSRTAPSRSGAYADGTYSAIGTYGSVPSSITVTLTLAGGVVTDAKVASAYAENDTSLGYQNRFAEAVPAVVVGKPVDEARVSRLAGSSGTPNGFNDALEQIKAQAAR